MALIAVTDNGDVPDFSKVSCSYNSCTDNTVSKEMYCVCVMDLMMEEWFCVKTL